MPRSTVSTLLKLAAFLGVLSITASASGPKPKGAEPQTPEPRTAQLKAVELKEPNGQIYFCFGALVAAILLSWYHDQSALLGVASAVGLAVWALERWPDDTSSAALATTFLLPLNFVLFASLRERGVTTIDGAFKVGIVGAQAAAVEWIAQYSSPDLGSVLRWGTQSAGWSPLSLAAQLSFAAAALTLLALIVSRRAKVEGLFWALVAVFFGLHEGTKAEALLFYAGTAGLVLVFAVLEHGYDIAYRDELRTARPTGIHHDDGTPRANVCIRAV